MSEKAPATTARSWVPNAAFWLAIVAIAAVIGAYIFTALKKSGGDGTGSQGPQGERGPQVPPGQNGVGFNVVHWKDLAIPTPTPPPGITIDEALASGWFSSGAGIGEVTFQLQIAIDFSQSGTFPQDFTIDLPATISNEASISDRAPSSYIVSTAIRRAGNKVEGNGIFWSRSGPSSVSGLYTPNDSSGITANQTVRTSVSFYLQSKSP